MQDDDGSTRPPSGQQARATTLIRLQVACAADTLVSLMAAHMSLSCVGRLRSVAMDGVVIEIPNPPETTLIGSTAAVTFPSGDGMVSFVSEISEVSDAPDGALLTTVVLPAQLWAGTRRQAVRVPVPSETVETTIVQGDDLRGPVRTVDISLHGILIELDDRRADMLAVGGTVALRIAMEQVEILVDAEVRRRDGRRYGLSFAPDGSPPDRLEKIMWKLQLLRMPPG